MFCRRLVMLSVVLMLAGFAMEIAPSPAAHAQDKKETKKEDTKKDSKKGSGLRDDWPKITGTLAKIVAVDVKKRTAEVELADGKKAELTLSKDVEFKGPRGGKADIEDERFVAGRTIKIVYDASGKGVKEIHLQVVKKTDKKPSDK